MLDAGNKQIKSETGKVNLLNVTTTVNCEKFKLPDIAI